jgi:hypothetical protein
MTTHSDKRYRGLLVEAFVIHGAATRSNPKVLLDTFVQ